MYCTVVLHCTVPVPHGDDDLGGVVEVVGVVGPQPGMGLQHPRPAVHSQHPWLGGSGHRLGVELPTQADLRVIQLLLCVIRRQHYILLWIAWA